ncbi:hypothetical protein TrRE_jg13028 [Triparma retinervis]|uniref:Uncharacterized protein n=1 Tax=Triparma retinervis TaxID=2557542 RepID=A0A9W7A4T9_9STRA|nr:hypothetical protein TrRE_jg13028 [Triparma retinervis]
MELYSRVNLLSPTSLQLTSGNSLVRWFGGLRAPSSLPGLPGGYSGGDATVVFHGAGGPDQYTDSLMGRNIHIIGISVGAFAADATISRLRKYIDQHPNAPKINLQLTLLDPFTQRGIFGVNWGIKNFGRNADYAQQYLNTDDPVPSTNEPCDNCAVFDVTNTSKRKKVDGEIFGHDWPLVHYTKYAKHVAMVDDSDKIARGTVKKRKLREKGLPPSHPLFTLGGVSSSVFTLGLVGI